MKPRNKAVNNKVANIDGYRTAAMYRMERGIDDYHKTGNRPEESKFRGDPRNIFIPVIV